jgi:hypothetical protein
MKDKKQLQFDRRRCWDICPLHIPAEKKDGPVSFKGTGA